MKRVLGILLLAFVVTSCTTTVSENEYNAAIAAISGSPKLQSATKAKCKRDVQQRNSRQDIAVLALVMNTSERKAIPLYCNRIVNALAKNKISYKEYAAGTRGKITPKFIKLIQGRI